MVPKTWKLAFPRLLASVRKLDLGPLLHICEKFMKDGSSRPELFENKRRKYCFPYEPNAKIAKISFEKFKQVTVESTYFTGYNLH